MPEEVGAGQIPYKTDANGARGEAHVDIPLRSQNLESNVKIYLSIGVFLHTKYLLHLFFERILEMRCSTWLIGLAGLAYYTMASPIIAPSDAGVGRISGTVRRV